MNSTIRNRLILLTRTTPSWSSMCETDELAEEISLAPTLTPADVKEGHERQEDLTAKDIETLRVLFRPCTKLKKQLEETKFAAR